MSEKKTIAFDLGGGLITGKKNKTSSKKTRKNTDDVVINSNNVRKMLLDKLKQYKKQEKTRRLRKNEIPTMNNTKNIYEEYADKIKSKRKSYNVNLDTLSKDTELPKNPELGSMTTLSVSPDVNTSSILQSPPPYSNLKNTTTPTYREYIKQNQTQTYIPTKIQEPELINNDSLNRKLKKVIKRKMMLGKSDKKRGKIGVLICNNKTRRNVEDYKVNNKNTNIKTVKNYLKNRNLIKTGTSCPSLLLREIYENIRLCGDVKNTNSGNMISNYLDNEKI